MRLPANILLRTIEEFGINTIDVPDIAYDAGTLPTKEAYDSVYTLAHLTMTFPGYTVEYQLFLEAYRRVGAEWSAIFQRDDVPRPYVVIHMRQDDKIYSESDTYTIGGSSAYCTFDILAKLSNYDIPVVLISDDEDAKRRLLSDFGHLLTVPNAR